MNTEAAEMLCVKCAESCLDFVAVVCWSLLMCVTSAESCLFDNAA